MKFTLISVFVLNVFCLPVMSQYLKGPEIDLKLKAQNESTSKLFDNSSKSGMPAFIAMGMIFLVINPELVVENKKAYFGLTKELSVGKYPYGRLAFEYTYVFRDYSRNHFRFSYNQDFIIKSKGDFYAPCISGGLGYFTDTDHKGYFAQVSAGIILPLPIGIIEGVYAYLKGRHTFVEGNANSNITDFSLGMSWLLYY